MAKIPQHILDAHFQKVGQTMVPENAACLFYNENTGHSFLGCMVWIDGEHDEAGWCICHAYDNLIEYRSISDKSDEMMLMFDNAEYDDEYEITHFRLLLPINE